MTGETLFTVFMHMLRCEPVYIQAVRAGLAPEHFDGFAYAEYRVVFAALRRYYSYYHVLPKQLALNITITQDLEHEPVEVPDIQQRVRSFLGAAYSLPDEELVPEVVTQQGMLQDVVNTFVVAPHIRAIQSSGGVQEQMAAITTAHTVMQASQVVANKRGSVFSQSNRADFAYKGEPMKTGIDWMDIAVRGLYPGSMCGLLAESSGGKTMFGVQFVIEAARRENKVAAFFYEQSLVGDITTRLYSYATGLPRDRFEKAYEDYDQETVDALNTVEPLMEKYFFDYDMSGRVQGQGVGCVSEIDGILREMEAEGNLPKFVLIDWLGPMVIRAFNIPELADAKDRREKIDVTLNLLKAVCDKYGVVVMVLHQIAPGEIANKSPTFLPDWTVAAECKGFGFLMNYVFVFGRKDPKTQCMYVNVPKARGAANTHRIVMMDAQHNRIVDVDSTFVVRGDGDKDNGYFMQKGASAQNDDFL